MKRKLLLTLGLLFFLAIFLGCSQKEKKEIPKPEENSANSNPIEDAANYAPKMIDTKKKAENNIQNAVGQENKKLDDALKQ